MQLCALPLLLAAVVAGARVAEAARGGEADANRHRFAGYVGIPNVAAAAENGCSASNIFYSCGGSLVDFSRIDPRLPSNQLVLTAGHCVDPDTHDTTAPFVFHFDDRDLRVVDATCDRVVGYQSAVPPAVYYSGVEAWTPYVPPNGGGVAGSVTDYAILLLDRPVTDRAPARVWSWRNERTEPFTKQAVPLTGLAGYGIAAVGDPLGNPAVEINGPRAKMFVNMTTGTVAANHFISNMVVARGDQSACFGDSGSGAFTPTDAAPGAAADFVIYGVVSGGDPHCRATNTFGRVGTRDFESWVAATTPAILARLATLGGQRLALGADAPGAASGAAAETVAAAVAAAAVAALAAAAAVWRRRRQSVDASAAPPAPAAPDAEQEEGEPVAAIPLAAIEAAYATADA